MSIFIIIALILIALSVIGVIVVRKFPELASMNVDESPREKQRKLKHTIALGRLLRKAQTMKQKALLKVSWERVKYVVGESYQKLKIFEEKYKTHTTEAKIKILLKRGQNNVIEDPELAEQCFLEVITLDARNLPAYEGLSQIYLARKNFNEAIEILEFLVKLNSGLAGRYLFDLSYALQEAGDKKGAWQHGREALTFEPTNPKYLDFLIEIAILDGHKKEGVDYLQTLIEVNPENAKIEDFKKRLEEI